jgi:tRNA 2-selenouridine synthase SelU
MGTEATKAEAESIIKDALRRELALFESRERLTHSEVLEMERKYGMKSHEFLDSFQNSALGDDQDYFVWWSLIHGLEAIRSRKDKIERMLFP